MMKCILKPKSKLLERWRKLLIKIGDESSLVSIHNM
jgi:hypothetical protein